MLVPQAALGGFCLGREPETSQELSRLKHSGNSVRDSPLFPVHSVVLFWRLLSAELAVAIEKTSRQHKNVVLLNSRLLELSSVSRGSTARFGKG